MLGKYLNGYGIDGNLDVPPGWTNWQGLVGNAVYYNYTLSNNGKAEKHGDNYATDYLTDLIANRSVSFILDQHKANPNTPLFLYVAPPAAHDPDTPAPQYAKLFSDVKLPKNPNYNNYDPKKHWVMKVQQHPLPNDFRDHEKFRDRLRTLVSVDDMVGRLVSTMEALGRINNTIFIYTSDNGFHIGQHCLVWDKRMLYEHDVRVPLMVRGPRFPDGMRSSAGVASIDMTPSILDFAGVSIPSDMDGVSIKPLLASNPVEQVRPDLLVEYHGENFHCFGPKGNLLPHCWDQLNNTYSCVRTMGSNFTGNMMYCEFADDVNFKEFYDLDEDPYQLSNSFHSADPSLLEQLRARLHFLKKCVGRSCKVPPKPVMSFHPKFVVGLK